MFSFVKSFNEITLIPRALVVLDIDETIMAFPDITKEWWSSTYDKNYQKHLDYSLAKKDTINEWKEEIHKRKPYLLDPNGLESFLTDLEKNNCDLLLLTARHPDLTEQTHSHLNHCGLYFSESEVVHDENKGEALASIVMSRYIETSTIIFVDDMADNLHNVRNKFSTYPLLKYNLQLYQIDHSIINGEDMV